MRGGGGDREEGTDGGRRGQREGAGDGRTEGGGEVQKDRNDKDRGLGR